MSGERSCHSFVEERDTTGMPISLSLSLSPSLSPSLSWAIIYLSLSLSLSLSISLLGHHLSIYLSIQIQDVATISIFLLKARMRIYVLFLTFTFTLQSNTNSLATHHPHQVLDEWEKHYQLLSSQVSCIQYVRWSVSHLKKMPPTSLYAIISYAFWPFAQ